MPSAYPQGMYDSAAPGSTAAQLDAAIAKMQEQRDAGLTYLLNYSGLYGSPDNVLKYGLAAWDMGMNLIWPLHHPDLYSGDLDVSDTYKDMAAYFGFKAPSDAIKDMLAVVRGIPSTAMIYVADEPLTAYINGVNFHSYQRVRPGLGPMSPSVPRLVMHFDYDGNGGSRLDPYLTYNDAVGLDCYPLGLPSGSQPITRVRDAALALKTKGAGKTRVMVCQAFSWSQFEDVPVRWPTVSEYTTMRSYAEQASPTVVLWWAHYIMRRAPDYAQRWADFKAGVLT